MQSLHDEKMNEVIDVNVHLEDMIHKYAESQEEYISALWKSIESLTLYLNNCCDRIEADEFDILNFYNEVCTIITRPKEM